MEISMDTQIKYKESYFQEAVELFALRIINGILFNSISLNQGNILIKHGLNYKYTVIIK